MQNKPTVIFINQAAAYLTIDILNAFSEDYDCILYTGKILPLSSQLNKQIQVNFFTRYDNSTSFKRIFTWSLFTIQVFFKLLFFKKSVSLFIVSNPPTAPFLGYLLQKIRGFKYHLLIYDIYPDALVQMGKIKKEGFIHKQWTKFNRILFKCAKTITTISPNMGRLINCYNRNIDVNIIQNWADTSAIQPLKKSENIFAIEYGQTDKITVMYSGNMGATHAIEKIADLALEFINDPSFSFLLIGEGNKKQLLLNLKEKNKLNNLSILPYQSAEILPYSLACADVGIITLSAGAEDVSIPSKTFNLLAAGVALMVIASKNSDLSQLIDQYECGEHFEEHELERMVEFLRSVKNDPSKLHQMKMNARKASSDFTPANAFKYKSLLNSKINVRQVV